MSRTIVGLDITETALSAVVLRSALRSKAVVAFSRFPLTGPAPFDEALEQALDALVSQISLKEACWVASVPDGWVSLRNIRVPFVEPKKIRQIVPYEIEPLLAQPLDEMIVDFHLGAKVDGAAADIIAAVAPRALIQDLLERLTARKINPAWITAGHYALPCCLAALSPQARNSLCVSSTARHFGVAAIVAGRLALMHRFARSDGNAVTAAALCAALQQTVSMVEAFGLGSFAPECVWLGGEMPTDDLRQRLSAETDPLAVQMVDLTRQLDRRAIESYPPEWPAGVLDNALALALLEAESIVRINFRRGSLAPRQIWEEYKRPIGATIAVAVLAAAVGLAGIILDVHHQRQRVRQIDEQIAAVFRSAAPEDVKMVDPLGQIRNRIEQIRKQARFAENREGGHLVLDILADISSGIAPNLDVAVNRLEIGADSVALSGDTAAFEAVNQMRQRLQSTASFKEVTIASTNKDKTGSRVQFKLQMEIR